MEEFPEDLNRETCLKNLEKNQSEMLKEVRNNFYNTIKKSVENCDSYVKLEFPEKMWTENKIIIISELLQRFGVLKIKQQNTEHDVKKTLQIGVKDIPKNVTQVIIEFNRN